MPVGREEWFARGAVLALLMSLASQAFPTVAAEPEDSKTATEASGDTSRPGQEDTLHIWNGAALGYNQVVVGDQLRVYRKMPWGDGSRFLTSQAHWRLGVMNTFGPTFLRPALLIGVSPLLILDVDLHYGPVINFFHYRYEGFDEPYGWDDRAGQPHTIDLFHQLTLNVQLKAAVGKWAVLEAFDAEYFASSDYYFNWEIGTILKSGFFTRTKTYVLYEIRPGWRAFVDYEHFRYYANSWRSRLLATGLYLTDVIPAHTTLMAFVGYHLENPDFQGIKLWVGAFWEWDRPWPRRGKLEASRRAGRGSTQSGTGLALR